MLRWSVIVVLFATTIFFLRENVWVALVIPVPILLVFYFEKMHPEKAEKVVKVLDMIFPFLLAFSAAVTLFMALSH